MLFKTLFAACSVYAAFVSAVDQRDAGTHACAHDTHVASLTKQRFAVALASGWVSSIPGHLQAGAEAHRAVNAGRRQALESDPAPIRIHVDYQLDALQPDERAFLMDDIVPA
ncbi:hypothetical protein CYMTET_43404, partial [Cymbomonas tetramitiformis]